jgi:ATP-dependent DNA ligase
MKREPAASPRPVARQRPRRSVEFALPPDTSPMEAALANALPRGAGWQYEPKWDGFRCLVFKAGDRVELRAKSGKPLGRYFPEVEALLRSLASERFVVDGELLIAAGQRFDFEALQMRLHPAASRILRLAHETPAVLMLFDLLADEDGVAYLERPLDERRRRLEAFVARTAAQEPGLQLSPATRKAVEAQRWLDDTGLGTDGVVAKRIDGAYLPGERAMIKVKRIRTADCVVGGFRYGRTSREVASLLLGLYGSDGLLHHVGFTSAIPPAERAALTRRLESLIEPPGFTGNAPGGPSRWSTERSAQWQPLRPALVAEVAFDHVSGGRIRHGTRFVRWRPDKSPAQCTMVQIERG